MKVKINKLYSDAITPVYSSKSAAGADLYNYKDEVTVKAGETVFIGTGIVMEIPEGYVGLVFARSGLACKHGLAPANKVGVIDSDYRGE
ncbi:MAG: dUTP diphosphatase, partial [Clostridia bacterium]|nr:dUTP diphosphatase [Clostridia bacterium]